MKKGGRCYNTIGALLYGAMALIGQLPAWWHYGVADLLALLLHRVVRYRRTVVQDQLKRSYPDKDNRELSRLEREVYRHLADLVVEYFMLAGWSRKSLQRHIVLEGAEQVEAWHQAGHKVAYLALGHYGNWEWLTAFQAYLSFTQLHVLYKPQRGVTDYVMRRLRSKFGTCLIDKNQAPRTIMSMRQGEAPQLLIFVADQTPSPRNIHLYTSFLRRQTATFTGMERLARKTASPVAYLDVRREGRGRYVGRVEVLTHNAAEHPFGELSALFMRRLERTIDSAPQHWLWSHRRWKYEADEVRQLYPQQEIVHL